MEGLNWESRRGEDSSDPDVIVCSPRPNGSRRISVAKKRGRAPEERNYARKLLRREGSGAANIHFTRAIMPQRFRNLKLHQEYDTHDPKAHVNLELAFLKRRSRVVEIVAAKDIVFALAHSGICAAFCRYANKRICFLNVKSDEVIRSLFYNKNNNSLITVSVYASDNFSSLKCRTTPIEYIRRGRPADGFPLFESESLRWPGFVEFDDVNGKVFTYSAQDAVYKIFDLKNYEHLYSIPDEDVQEIKISPGIMLRICNRKATYVPLEVLSIEDGKVLKVFEHALTKNKKLEFIEQFNEMLLVKQENERLRIVNILTTDTIKVDHFHTPDAFIFLYENQLFLTFRTNKVQVWNFKGELVTEFEDHELRHPGCNTNNIFITSDQDHIISYCRYTNSDDSDIAGSINISNIHTGQRVSKVEAANGKNGRDAAALKDVTALFYDEERNEIFTGTKNGLVHVWAH